MNDGLLDWLKTPEAQGLLSMVAVGMAGARKGQPINSMGRAAMGGLQGYGGALDRQDKGTAKRLQEMQLAQLTAQMGKQTALDKAAADSYTPAIAGSEGIMSPDESGMVGASPATPAVFDDAGYANRIKGVDPMAYYKLQKEGKTSEMKNWDFGKTLSPEDQLKFGAKSGNIPSNIQEWNSFKDMKPEEQARFIEMKRALPTLNLGGTQVQLAPGGGIKQSFPVTPKVEDTAEFKANVSAKIEDAKAGSERKTTAAAAAASLPGLESVVADLKEIGKKATYTKAGQFRDTIVRESGGAATEGAVNRELYIQKVRSVLLPQLKATFGAAFTVKEMEALVATMGDPDRSPEEKDAALDSFIEQKRATAKSLKTEAGIKEESYTPRTISLKDIADTARASGRTTKEVTDAFKARGDKIGTK